MQVFALDHVNLKAPRALLDELCAFYRDVVGLRVGPRPPFKRFGYWLYAGERPVLHLGEARADEPAQAHVRGTFDHASFNCSGRAEFELRLARHGVAYRVAEVPLTGQTQLFFTDPGGNGVELAFPADEGRAGG